MEVADIQGGRRCGYRTTAGAAQDPVGGGPEARADRGALSFISDV